MYDALEWLHAAIWLVAVFGGLASPKLARLNIFVFLPLIYLVHFLPFHPITFLKAKWIVDHAEDFEDLASRGYPPPEYVKNTARSCPPGSTREQIELVARVFHAHENGTGFYKAQTFFGRSFGNPLSPQGLVILGFIVNVMSLKFVWKKI